MPSGLLDTCVLIDYLAISPESLPVESMVSAISLGELSVGVQYATDPVERSLRVNRLLMVQANMAALPFTEDAAQVYGNLNALVLAAGRNPRPRRLDLLIAATAVAAGVPLYTRNIDDFKGLESQLTVVPV
ncbi:MAG TPA: type II toxin-antitoxin system VapC family toxin [Actinospica sp.]|jgi:predicted nucleic acid-binding protein|nr:type II toxin-antitoxin system VapC family toxin [Actinospica sp.]